MRNKQTISAPEESVLETICCSNKTVHYKQTVCAPEESVLETIGCSNKTVHDKQTISAAEQTNLCNTNKQICAPTNLFIYKQSVASTKLWTTNNQSVRQKNVLNCKKSIAFSRTVLQRVKLFVNIVLLVVDYIFVYKSKKQPCNYKVLDASMICTLQKKNNNNNLCSRRSLLGANQFGAVS